VLPSNTTKPMQLFGHNSYGVMIQVASRHGEGVALHLDKSMPQKYRRQQAVSTLRRPYLAPPRERSVSLSSLRDPAEGKWSVAESGRTGREGRPDHSRKSFAPNFIRQSKTQELQYNAIQGTSSVKTVG